jgi:t-SNARE complex subunit (syntaxin)
MANEFVSVMETIGKDVKALWADVVKYLPAAAKLAELIFPAQTAVIASAVNSVDLIQQAVVTVEQKFAATGNLTRRAVPYNSTLCRSRRRAGWCWWAW